MVSYGYLLFSTMITLVFGIGLNDVDLTNNIVKLTIIGYMLAVIGIALFIDIVNQKL